jgi:hypothetical protein
MNLQVFPYRYKKVQGSCKVRERCILSLSKDAAKATSLRKPAFFTILPDGTGDRLRMLVLVCQATLHVPCKKVFLLYQSAEKRRWLLPLGPGHIHTIFIFCA